MPCITHRARPSGKTNACNIVFVLVRKPQGWDFSLTIEPNRLKPTPSPSPSFTRSTVKNYVETLRKSVFTWRGQNSVAVVLDEIKKTLLQSATDLLSVTVWPTPTCEVDRIFYNHLWLECRMKKIVRAVSEMMRSNKTKTKLNTELTQLNFVQSKH